MLLQHVVPRIKNLRIVLIHHQCTSQGQPHCRKATCIEYVHSRKCDMRFTYTHLDKQFLLNLCGHCHGFLCYPPYWSDYVTILNCKQKREKKHMAHKELEEEGQPKEEKQNKKIEILWLTMQIETKKQRKNLLVSLWQHLQCDSLSLHIEKKTKNSRILLNNISHQFSQAKKAFR